MIRPQPQPGTALPRIVATVLTGALLVGAQAGLKDLAIPAFASNRSVIRELDPLMLERFAVPPTPAPEAESEAEEETPEPEELTTVSFDEEVVAAVEQLEELFAAESPTPAADREAPDAAAAEAGGIAAAVPDERFESLFGVDAGVAAGGRAAARRGGRDAPGAGGLGIGLEARPSTDDTTAPSGGLPGPGVAVRTGTARESAGAGEELEIEARDPEAFDESSAARLGAWMRANAAELPVGVRVHMNYVPSFLTAVAAFSNEGRDYDLFLMFNESLREVHVVLVEGDRSVYLIDRGFQEQSRSLREGLVRRTGGQIVAIDSRTGAASGDRSRDFYDVFLSWWASVDPGAGEGR